MKKIYISVIIPTYRDWERLALCLASLRKQTLNSNFYEVIVVNNDPLSGCPYELPTTNMRIIEEEQPGSYSARNKGAELAKGEILAFTDSDCIPEKNWLQQIVKSYNQGHNYLIGGKVEIFRDSNGSRISYIYEKNKAFQQHLNVPKGNSVTANLLVPQSIFKRMEGFDGNIKSGGDWEFTQRCIRSGYSMIYEKDIRVFHPARKNVLAILKKQYRFICWGSINLQKNKNYSKFRIFFFNLYHELRNLLDFRSHPKNLFEFFLVFYVDFLRFISKSFINLLITIDIINPSKVRQ